MLVPMAISFGVEWLSHGWFVVVSVAYLLALLSLPSVLLKRRGRPQAALAWSLILLTLPIVGLFCWWAFGRRHLVRRRREKRRSAQQFSRRLSKLHDELPRPPEADWELTPIGRLASYEEEGLSPPTKGNRLQLLCSAEQAYPAMIDLIEQAIDHIHLIFYIWQNDSTGRCFRDLLVARAQAGVEVRLLLDAVGSHHSAGSFMAPLREAGGRVEVFSRPIFFQRRLDLNFRNHRKLLLVDGRAAVVGGLNIGDEHTGDWIDAAILIEGPEVDRAQEVFADDWYFATDEDFTEPRHFDGWTTFDEEAGVCGLVASGPHTEINLTHEAFFTAINEARKRICITTPYFVPDLTILAALRSAAFRGLDVRLILPERGDSRLADFASRSYFPELLRAGGRVFLYQDGVLHGKTAMFDDNLTVVGSANMDIRSFRLNFELSCFARDAKFAQQMAAFYERTLPACRELTLEDVEQTSYLTRLAESAANLMSPLL